MTLDPNGLVLLLAALGLFLGWIVASVATSLSTSATAMDRKLNWLWLIAALICGGLSVWQFVT